MDIELRLWITFNQFQVSHSLETDAISPVSDPEQVLAQEQGLELGQVLMLVLELGLEQVPGLVLVLVLEEECLHPHLHFLRLDLQYFFASIQ